LTGPFDSEKYAKLLEGLDATEVRLLDLNLDDRLDAEYFSKENLLISKRLHNRDTRRLGQLGKFAVSAFYPAATHLYGEGDVAFVRCVDCIIHPVISNLQDDAFERIPSSFIAQHNSIDTVGEGDIVITKVGSPCYASIVHKHDELALSRTVMGLKNIEGINAYYLLAFLRSKYGFGQLLRQRELTIQYQLTVERVRAVDVFLPTDEFQSHIESVVKSYHQQLEQSNRLHEQGEQTLLSDLGLLHWQPPEPLSYERKASEAFGSGRLDSEYFHPRYESLASFLADRFTVEPVGTWGKVLKGSSLRYAEDVPGVPVIRSGDLSDLDDEHKFLRAYPDQEMFILKDGDVLISSIGFGSIGKVQVFDKLGKYATVSEVTVIRQERVNPYFLHFYLRSSAGQMQINRRITGATGQLHLYPKDVASILVPMVTQELEQKLETQFKESRRLKSVAKQLFENAKRAVEIAIEESEEAAMKFLHDSEKINGD
jgi:type I restriction enzyme M protein